MTLIAWGKSDIVPIGESYQIRVLDRSRKMKHCLSETRSGGFRFLRSDIFAYNPARLGFAARPAANTTYRRWPFERIAI